jgi:F-type H+-transporting ATPase subunit c
VKVKLFLLSAALLALASPVFAQGSPVAAAVENNWPWVVAALAMAIASAGCGIAQAKAIAAACEGTARNPGAAANIRFALILGLALIESLALYTLVIVFYIFIKRMT